MPEVAISLIVEDMDLSPHTHSRKRLRDEAYNVLRVSRDYGELVNGPSRDAADLVIDEATWQDILKWEEICDGRGIFGNELNESDTDELLAALKGAMRGNLDDSDIIEENRESGSHRKDARGGNLVNDRHATFEPDGQLNDSSYVPPMYGSPLPYGVSESAPVDPETQEALSQVRCPNPAGHLKPQNPNRKAPRLARIATAAERAEKDDRVIKALEAAAAQSVVDAAQKEKAKMQKENEQRENARKKVLEGQQRAVDKARRAQEKVQQAQERAIEISRQKAHKAAERLRKAAETAQAKASDKAKAKAEKAKQKEEKAAEEARTKQIGARKKLEKRKLAAIEKGRKAAEKEQGRISNAPKAAGLSRPKPKRRTRPVTPQPPNASSQLSSPPDINGIQVPLATKAPTASTVSSPTTTGRVGQPSPATSLLPIETVQATVQATSTVTARVLRSRSKF